MRLTPAQIDTIISTAKAVLGEGAQVTLFGSRVDDTAKGGDVDLMIEVTEALADPAVVAARIASKVSRAMNGRKVMCCSKRPTCSSSPFTAMQHNKGSRFEVHEYIEDMNILVSALKAGQAFVPVLIATAQRFATQIDKLAP